MVLKTWWQALRTMPSLSKNEWQQLDLISRWLIASRASVLLMTLTSAAIGALLAWRDGYTDGLLFTLVVVGLLFAHATNNLLNDWTDSARGIDKDNYYRNQYGVHVLEAGFISRQRFFLYIAVTGLIAIAAGALLVYWRGGLTLPLMLLGAFFVLFYTWPLKYIGLGEPAVLLVWGPLMIGGCYYVVSGQWSWPVAWISLAYALGPTAVLFGKHTDKLDADAAKHVRSMPVLLGRKRSLNGIVAMIAVQYSLIVTLVAAGFFSPWLLLSLLAFPASWKAAKVMRHPVPEQKPADFPAEIWPLWYAPFAFDHTRKFGVVFLLGLVLDILLG